MPYIRLGLFYVVFIFTSSAIATPVKKQGYFRDSCITNPDGRPEDLSVLERPEVIRQKKAVVRDLLFL